MQRENSSYKNRINIVFVKLIAEALLVFCLTVILLFINLIISCSDPPSTLITACTTYFLKNAPLTILGNSDLEVMITLSAISMILPPSKTPFLIDVCLPVLLLCIVYCIFFTYFHCTTLFLCLRYFHRPSLFYQNFSMLLCKTCAFIKDYLT